jgi:UDP-3-O-[3-hydroxymyristoyl] N-acetylglucosamine deacetylase
MRYQKTLAKNFSASGVGLFTGAHVSMTVKPAEEDSGIVFKRLDIPDFPSIRANLEAVKATPRCTILGNQEFSISTVEHLMAAFSALGIVNALIELNGSEIPIFDGSSDIFVDLILKAGVVVQSTSVEPIHLIHPIFYSAGTCHIVALPAETFSVSYTLQFPDNYKIPTQFLSVEINQDTFINDVASARTFSSYEEIAPLIAKGFVLRGSLSSALVYKDGQVINPEGLRYKDECVRHKILDLIGDLALLERPLNAHILAIRSGHSANIALGRLINEYATVECV